MAATALVDLNEATREVLVLIASDLRRNRVFLRAELDYANALLITADRGRLQQVILNPVRNASDTTRPMNDRPRDLLVRVEREEEGGVRLIVKDAGARFELQKAGRLFEAFLTIKTDGMGVDLSGNRSIIEPWR